MNEIFKCQEKSFRDAGRGGCNCKADRVEIRMSWAQGKMCYRPEENCVCCANIQLHECETPASEGLEHQREDKNRLYMGGKRTYCVFLLHNKS